MNAAREPLDYQSGGPPRLDEDEHVIELKEEQIVARKRLVEAGEVVLHTEVDEVPGRLEVEAFHEEIEVEHVPIGRIVTERVAPWEEDGELVVPVYEEQLVVVKRLILKEQVRVCRVRAWERQLFEDTLRKERLVVEEPPEQRTVRELYPGEGNEAPTPVDDPRSERNRSDEGGLLGHLVRKALQ